MPDSEGPRLSLAEWVVLCLVCEKPVHGFALAGLLGEDGSLGQVWRVPRAVIYQAIKRLEQLGMLRPAGEQYSSMGPVRSLSVATPAGRSAAWAWLRSPVGHPRDVRSELLVKIALAERAGADPRELLRAQRDRLAPIASALDDRWRSAGGFDRTLALWRHEAIWATMRFLDAMTQ